MSTSGFRTWLTVGAGCLALAVVVLMAAGADSKPVPFPVDRSRILRTEGAVYLVEGRLTIPKGVEVSCQKDIYIRGVGKNATIVVQGSFQGHGVAAREIIFENVTVEPGESCQDLHLDTVIFRKGGGIRSAKGTSVKGKLFLEGVHLTGNTQLDVAMRGGSIDLAGIDCDALAKVVAVNANGRPNKLKVKVRGSVFRKGFELREAHDVTVRINSFAGERVTFVNCGTLIFDGNKVTAKRLEIVQQKAGRHKGTKLQKCDFYCDEISVWAPVQKGKSDTVKVDKCWFKGIEKAKDVHAKFLRDGNDDPKNGAKFALKKVNKRALELAGSLER